MFDPWRDCWQQGENLGPFPDSLFSLSGNQVAFIYWHEIECELASAILYVLPTTPPKYLVLRGAALCGSCNLCENMWRKVWKGEKMSLCLWGWQQSWDWTLSPSLQCPVRSWKLSSEAEFLLAMAWYLQKVDSLKARRSLCGPADNLQSPEHRSGSRRTRREHSGSGGCVETQWLMPSGSSGGLLSTAVSVPPPRGTGPAARAGLGTGLWTEVVLLIPGGFLLLQALLVLIWGFLSQLSTLSGVAIRSCQPWRGSKMLTTGWKKIY